MNERQAEKAGYSFYGAFSWDKEEMKYAAQGLRAKGQAERKRNRLIEERVELVGRIAEIDTLLQGLKISFVPSKLEKTV